MDNTLREAPPEGAAELQAAIRSMFEEMERIDVRIEQKQSEIERLKAETRAILADLKAAP
jgi:thiamine biosynthesis lipoprotein ApbE